MIAAASMCRNIAASGSRTLIALIALSIDDTRKMAKAHLKKNGWDKSVNMWAGEGAWQSEPVKAFGVRGIPRVFVIDAAGVLAETGHPGNMDIPEIVSGLLGGEK